MYEHESNRIKTHDSYTTSGDAITNQSSVRLNVTTRAPQMMPTASRRRLSYVRSDEAFRSRFRLRSSSVALSPRGGLASMAARRAAYSSLMDRRAS
jgi:hypothetical protein